VSPQYPRSAPKFQGRTHPQTGIFWNPTIIPGNGPDRVSAKDLEIKGIDELLIADSAIRKSLMGGRPNGRSASCSARPVKS
jgi:hypothetical protein